MKYQVVQSTGGTFVTIFYCRATSYSLSIEHNFVDNQFVSITNDADFAWYSKCGGENDGL